MYAVIPAPREHFHCFRVAPLCSFVSFRQYIRNKSIYRFINFSVQATKIENNKREKQFFVCFDTNNIHRSDALGYTDKFVDQYTTSVRVLYVIVRNVRVVLLLLYVILIITNINENLYWKCSVLFSHISHPFFNRETLIPHGLHVNIIVYFN